MENLRDPPRPDLFDAIAVGRLQWLPEIGVGYFPVREGTAPYNRAYFERYQQQADTDIGRALMRERVAFVETLWTGPLVDVGIGSGAFIDLRGHERTFGYDVNPVGIAWLIKRDLLIDVNRPRIPAAAFWDSLEHIPDFPRLLQNVTRWCFVSLPIFRDVEHVLASKHFRRDEHVWYFTTSGLTSTMEKLGWELAAYSSLEMDCGREDIGAFAFQRIRPSPDVPSGA